ncbi:coiled-coil domain-containing protein 106-like [Neoarius graeffei]|uniref:coiled-coil domain-containing protein 106-like n=1 Tax=Neoarius graeffei TaxID=443677 RepID=UPI00298C33AA|nr:coiled-coil domain-containing protein 106-like [Neoarius graeffei]
MEGKEETSSSSRKMQTRSGPLKDNAGKRSRCDTEDDSSGTVQMAPTAKLQKHKHDLELAKMKITCQEDLIKELTKEIDFLKDQLSQIFTLSYLTCDNYITTLMLLYSAESISRNVRNPSPEASTSHANFSASSKSSSESTDPSTDTSDSSVSSSSSTSDDRRKRKKKNTKKKKGKKGTRERRSKRSSILRARGPDEVIARYWKVLKAYKKKKSITAACKIVGVDRNTITLNAPIAEPSIAAPEKFAEFKEEHSTKQKLGDFAGKYLDGIRDNPDIERKVQALKKARQLLPVGKGDF